MRARILLPLIAALALIASACGDSDLGTTDSPGALDLGTDTWVLVSGTTGGTAIDVPDGHRIDMTASEDGTQVGGTAACNHYGGKVQRDGDAIAFTEFSWTEMACMPTEVMEAEQAFLGAMAKVKAGSRDGDTLVLTGNADTTLTFERQEPVPAADLIGTTWQWDTLITGDAASTVMGEAAILVLSEDGTFATGTGCRSLTGDYVVVGDTIEFPSMGADGECSAELAEQDGHVIEVFEEGVTVTIDGQRLTLTTTSGIGLGYLAAS